MMTTTLETTAFRTTAEILSLLRGFDDCTLPRERWTHAAHLTVALWYVWSLPYEAAAEKITSGIRRLAASYGKTGYHETITLFWLRMVSNFAAQCSDSLTTTANRLIEKYNNKDFIHEYYSAELLATDKAKSE